MSSTPAFTTNIFHLPTKNISTSSSSSSSFISTSTSLKPSRHRLHVAKSTKFRMGAAPPEYDSRYDPERKLTDDDPVGLELAPDVYNDEETPLMEIREAPFDPNEELPTIGDPEKLKTLDFEKIWAELFERSSVELNKRTDIKKILIIGAGAIVIGQGAEFDYSGTQACKALKSEGYSVVLVNSNPATIMTDPETADRVYIEPLSCEIIEKIIINEQPDALLPTMGGQTALNLSMTLAKNGVLDKHNVELIGAKVEAIEKGEDRLLFRQAMERIGVKCCPSGVANDIKSAREVADKIGSYPLIIRPAFTLGGTGGGIAYNKIEYLNMAEVGLDASPVSQIIVEKSLLGWKEYELEVMRDGADNVVIVCSIENLDPMGVHTGDSITVAPTQTLTDKEYQNLRDMSIAIIREIGVDTGGSNIQFSVNPENGDVIVIEMNPRVSRSSALASKATGFPIAKLAAKLSIGLSLVELKNDITKETPACFEPSLDYVVTKVPRFAFEKFSGANDTLSTQMRAVGEVMAIGRSFIESFQKALRSMETGRSGWGYDGKDKVFSSKLELEAALRKPTPDRIYYVKNAFESGMSIEDVFNISKYDPWFLSKMYEIFELGEDLKKMSSVEDLDLFTMFNYKSRGFSDKQIANVFKIEEEKVRIHRKSLGVVPVYKTVDTCSAEFEAYTPYLYSCYESSYAWGEELKLESETPPLTGKKKIIILGQGPNRIGQGIEFDYCCVHACFALRDAGFETVMINSNPETVSTDYDTADRLYFEPLTLEDVIGVIEAEKADGILIQFGGQTPLKLAVSLEKYLNSEEAEEANVHTKILGTSPDSIDAAEDRDRFIEILKQLNIRQPANGIARSYDEAELIASNVEYPVVVRPSYVLGGRGMEIVYNQDELKKYMSADVVVESEHPVLIDKFLDHAIEVDVDAIADTHGNVIIGGIMEHIEAAGIHSGDSACAIPTYSVPYNALVTIRSWTVALAKRLGVIGLMNVQWAVQGEQVYILEANPRASRTVPFVSKAIGQPLAKIASLVMMGANLNDLGLTKEILPRHTCVKEAVLPFKKFPGADILLSPEMRSTGEVMGIDDSFAMAYAKAEIASGLLVPTSGTIFMSLGEDEEAAVPLAVDFVDLGFKILAVRETYVKLISGGLNPSDVEMVLKTNEGRPHVLDKIKNGEVNLYICSPTRKLEDLENTRATRTAALASNLPYVTTVSAARALAQAIRVLQTQEMTVKAMQDFHRFLPPIALKGIESVSEQSTIVGQQSAESAPDAPEAKVAA